jgi:D-serine ammonia-lyase
MSVAHSSLYPTSPVGDIKAWAVGKNLRDLPCPAAILDIAKVKRNCKQMLDAVTHLGLSFRAHVKTHKTSEITQISIGKHSKDVRLITSTVIEVESLLPLLQGYQDRGACVNVLYGVPIAPSHVARLAAVATQLGPGTITLMVDHPSQSEALKQFRQLAGFAAQIFLKTDSGYHRAGLPPLSKDMVELVKHVSQLEATGIAHLQGFYSHNSLSYGGSSPDEAMDMLKVEIDVCKKAAKHLNTSRAQSLTISVGASPTALSIQNILPSRSSTTASARDLMDTLQLTVSDFELEIHAGVYPIFDLQQIAASSRSFSSDPHDSIAATVLAEVCSLYPNRTEKPEALISAGCLALAREPCKSYPGWGVVTNWNMPHPYTSTGIDRIIVSRISQEHGILAYESESKGDHLPLTYGQKLRLFPNHACITLAMFGWYFIVDSSTDTPDTVVDIWSRWRGW